MEKEKKKEYRKIAGMLAGILLLLTAAGALLAGGAKNRKSTAVEPTHEEKIAAVNADNGTKPFTVLLAGCDRASGLTDVLMLVRLDGAGGCTVLQIPRDTYAAYTDAAYRKLNGAARSLGGMAQLRDFLAGAFGVKIDRYARLNLDALRHIVDAMGGVELELPMALDYEDPEQGLTIHLPAGWQRLNGEAAEQFVRFRSGYVRGDIGRMDAQKLFLAAVFRRFRGELSLGEVTSLVSVTLENLETDLTLTEAMTLANAGRRVQAKNIRMLTLPGSDAVAHASGASYYVLSSASVSEVLRQYFDGGEFDPGRVFCNPAYDDFCKIYEGYVPYIVYDAEKIVENGIQIAATH